MEAKQPTRDWKETVMSRADYQLINTWEPSYNEVEPALCKQAKVTGDIAYKAGQEDAEKKALIAENKLINKVSQREFKRGQEAERERIVKDIETFDDNLIPREGK